MVLDSHVTPGRAMTHWAGGAGGATSCRSGFDTDVSPFKLWGGALVSALSSCRYAPCAAPFVSGGTLEWSLGCGVERIVQLSV